MESRNVTTPDTLMDLIRQMFPPNLIQVNPRHPDSVCVCVSDRQLNMVICRAVTLDNMIKWIQDIARSLKLHPGLEIFFANLEENISVVRKC